MEGNRELREEIRQRLLEAGASAVGFAKAEPVDQSDRHCYDRWLEDHANASLEYMERNRDLRDDPRLLIAQLCDTERPVEGTVISMAFNYLPEKLRPSHLPYIARFAYGEDYHRALRKRLKGVCKEIGERFGCKTKICIDSAPVRERYWAVKSGIAFRGRNGLVIVPGLGSYFFLAEILTTQRLPADEPDFSRCIGCGKCLAACPVGAIRPDSTVDCRRCLSYATIEAPGSAPDLHRRLFGCDTCQLVCPHNKEARPTKLREFEATPQILDLTPQLLLKMTNDEFADFYAHSPLKRAGLVGIKANLSKL